MVIFDDPKGEPAEETFEWAFSFFFFFLLFFLSFFVPVAVKWKRRYSQALAFNVPSTAQGYLGTMGIQSEP